MSGYRPLTTHVDAGTALSHGHIIPQRVEACFSLDTHRGPVPALRMAPKTKQRKQKTTAAAATTAAPASQEHSWLMRLSDEVLDKILKHHIGSLLTTRESCLEWAASRSISSSFSLP
jgi:hypothetical protein